MPKPRKQQISLDATPYYHCMSRCVRRAFLCGTDNISGKSYEHRRQWLEEQLLLLAEIFAIDICAYAVMSNHYHVVLHINAAQAHHWSNREVVERWHRLYRGSVLSQKFLRNQQLSEAEHMALEETITCWRLRLMNISWFMRTLNEPIARKANQEDQCTGRFWEGRFTSQALLDEKALIACMAYVDLNPIRAKMANSPETSDHTSVQQRITQQQQYKLNEIAAKQPSSLMPFTGNLCHNMPNGLPFALQDYLELVDWTGRIVREDKRGSIPSNMPLILERLDIEPKHWLFMTRHFESKFKNFVGHYFKIKQACQQLGYRRTPGLSACKPFF